MACERRVNVRNSEIAPSHRRVRRVELDIGTPQTVVGVPVRQQHSATQRSAVNVNDIWAMVVAISRAPFDQRPRGRSEEHTSELQSLMRISYAVFCLKKKKTHN